MLKINFLPWRQRQKHQSKVIQVCSVFCFFIAVFTLIFFHFSPKKAPPPPPIKEQPAKKIKWMGFVKSDTQIVGLMKVNDSPVMEVQTGQMLDPDIKVVAVHESGAQILRNGKEERVGDEP